MNNHLIHRDGMVPEMNGFCINTIILAGKGLKVGGAIPYYLKIIGSCHQENLPATYPKIFAKLNKPAICTEYNK